MADASPCHEALVLVLAMMAAFALVLVLELEPVVVSFVSPGSGAYGAGWCLYMACRAWLYIIYAVPGMAMHHICSAAQGWRLL